MALVLLPLLILAWASLLPFYQPPGVAALRLITLRNYARVLGSSTYPGMMLNTVIAAAASATVVMLLAVVVGWLEVRRTPGGATLARLAMLPLALPGLILGLAVMQLFLRAAPGLYGTIWILIWAFTITGLPYGVRASIAAHAQVAPDLEEAACLDGALPLTRLRRIVVPLISPVLLAGWLVVFLLAARVVALPILLSGPGSETIPVAIFDTLRNGQVPELAALGLVWLAGLMAPLLACRRLVSRALASCLAA